VVTVIVAMAANRVIGINNSLPWCIPDDLKRFKRITMGKSVIMGRKTFESIGRPLPGRTNIVLSGSGWSAEGTEVCSSIESALQSHPDAIVIGGSQVYSLALPFADVIEMTLVDKNYEGDTLFPELGPEWVESCRETHNNGSFDYHYLRLERKR
jgi:dihydrofolate reductase